MTGAARRIGPVWAALLALILVLSAAMLRARTETELHETAYVFGTLVEIVIRSPDEDLAKEAASDVGALFQDLHSEWHAWRPGAVTDLNRAIAQGQSLTVSPRVAALTREAQVLSAKSGGRFDPGIGQLIALWGFHQDTAPEGKIPAPDAIAALQTAAPSIADLTIADGAISSTNRTVALDFGGFAKGAALALAADLLRERGIDDAVLNAGGDVTVLGRHGARPWRVAIRDPFVWGAVAAVDLGPDESLYTSGNYERYFEQGGTRFAHILDPRTGYPVQEIVSVSVLDPDPALADAGATALAVAGRQEWPAVAAAMGLSAVLMITEDGQLLASPAMARRLTAIDPARLAIVPLPDAQ